MAEQLRALTPDDRPQAVALGALAFGGDPAAPVTSAPPGARSWGVVDGDALLAKATLRSYTQWWGGRRVPMAGVASVAVHPDARGRGSARRLLTELVHQTRAAGEPVSVLFPTAPGIYRSLGWETVRALEHTRLPVAQLAGAGDPRAVALRSAGPEDLPALTRLWHEAGAASDGLLTRDGPSFPHGLQDVLSASVVPLAEDADGPAGYLAYDRGRGYGPDAELRTRELVARTPAAAAALLRSLASWDSVVGSVLWRGSLLEVGLLVRGALPPPETSQPWMLRVTDAPAAVAARGYPASVRTSAVFRLVDPLVPEHEGSWELVVEDGHGRLERTSRGGPLLQVRGLALLWTGAADTALLQRAGLLDGPAPGLDALARARPRAPDYF